MLQPSFEVSGKSPARIAGDPAERLRRLLEPRSIAVIGASDRPGNLGKAVIDNLIKFRFPGSVWPVHPTAKTVGGSRCFSSVRDLPGVPDMALLALGAGSLLDAIQQCVDVGTLSGIALAGGFSELGEEGRVRQAQLARLCAQSGFALCGPNCIGIINTHMPMAATFASALLSSEMLLPGNISIVSQSGGIATFFQALARSAGFGVRYAISSGNEATVTTADFIAAFAADPLTKVICSYIEGVQAPDRLLTALAAARHEGKPVVLLKAGSTPESAVAAMAHTGALAGEERVWNAVLREHAVIRVHSLEEMLDVALFVSGHRVETLPKGRGVAIVGFGGGGGVLGADQCVANGLAVAQLEVSRRERLRTQVPPIASIANPFDLTPDSYNKAEYLAKFPSALAEIAADASVHTLLFQLGAVAHKAPEIMSGIEALRARTDKAIAVAWPLTPPSVAERLPRQGIHVFSDPARALRVIGHAARFVAERALTRKVSTADLPAVDHWPCLQGPGVLPEHVCAPILARAGLSVAAGCFVPAGEDVAAACSSVGYPVAMKGVAGTITHRAAAGLIALSITSANEARATAAMFNERAVAQCAKLDGIYVQRMMARGTELIVGAFRDPLFGVIVTCGAGGNLTELLDDVELERAPVDETTAARMLERLRAVCYAMKGSRALDIGEPARFVSAFSRLATTVPWREFALEVNPIVWNVDGVVAVDCLAVIARS